MHRIFIDEVGNSDLKSSANDNERFLSLTGVIVELAYHDGDFTASVCKLKREIFGTDAICLHRREISRREAPFECLRDDAVRARFDEQLFTLFSSLSYRVITVVIDKREHQSRYRVSRYHPYHYCLMVMLERYVMHLGSIYSVGDVMAESRQRVDNERLDSAYRHFYNNGSDWMDAAQSQKVLSSRQLKIKDKGANVAGLQFADLLAHPSYKATQAQHSRTKMTADFGKRVVEILEADKYLKSSQGFINGSGRKWLP
jgi:hypothetical protein